MSIKNSVLVAHDAGGAEILGAYLQSKKQNQKHTSFVAGPAVDIFKNRRIHAKRVSPKMSVVSAKRTLRGLKNVDTVITGTGWGSLVELNFILAAKQMGVQTVCYLDHWVNYRERFGYPRPNWKNNLPDQIWVGDSEAFKLARSVFKNTRTKIILVANRFFAEIPARYRRAAARMPKRGKPTILFASEPVASARNAFGDAPNVGYSETETLKFILQALRNLKIQDLTLRIRLHPSEPKNKYDSLMHSAGDKVCIEKSMTKDMYEDLARADVVVGISSMFLVVASKAGKKVISVTPSTQTAHPLPKNIVQRIHSKKALKNYFMEAFKQRVI